MGEQGWSVTSSWIDDGLSALLSPSALWAIVPTVVVVLLASILYNSR